MSDNIFAISIVWMKPPQPHGSFTTQCSKATPTALIQDPFGAARIMPNKNSRRQNKICHSPLWRVPFETSARFAQASKNATPIP